MRTNITAISSAQSVRNEQRTLAEGSLAGERRVAIARIVMATLLALIAELPRFAGHLPSSALRSLVGIGYVAASIGVFWWLRLSRADPHRGAYHAPAMTLLDFAFITAMAILDHDEDGLAMHPTASAILIAFTVARYNLWHVAIAVLCAESSYVAVYVSGDAFDPHPATFVMGGYAVLGVVVGLTNHAVRTMFGDLRRRENLTRFLPDQVVQRVLASGTEALAPVQREVTILFSDIRGFTALSEALEPKAVLSLLDDYFGRMTQVVKGHDGVVGKFLGDGLMAFWGVPDHLEDHAVRATRAARDMRAVLRELNAERIASGAPELAIGIGIHTGVVAAGLLGGTQAEYTVIGDSVNVASRVESMTKELGVDLLFTHATWSQLGTPDRARHIATVPLRGRKEPVELYTLDAD